jgi:hypothetical protein
LLVGTLLVRGRPTVTAALRVMGHAADLNFSRFHQVLNRARWAPGSQQAPLDLTAASDMDRYNGL